jgi:RNA polymerase sigma factor (sigma-70 family)
LRTQPDERIVAMARDGGTAAFAEIVRRHRTSLLAFASTVAPPSRAEDVVQDSLLKAYASLRDGAEPEMLRAWLFRIVRNTAIDEQRGVRHHEQLDENYDGVEQPPQAFERRQGLVALVASIRDLPAAQREAIVKRELEGRGHEEIGRALKLSPGAVRQLIYRARHTLREAAGALIPVAVLRAAAMPGADQAAGGLGMAAAAKVGLAAVVATGTIVAGTSIDRRGDSATADSLATTAPAKTSHSSASEPPRGESGAEDRHSGGSGPSGSGRRSGESGSGEHSGGSGSSGPGTSSGSDGGSVSGSGSDHSGSGSSGSSGSSDGGGGTSGSSDGGPVSTGSSDGGATLSSGSTGGGDRSSGGSGDLLKTLDGGGPGPG